MGIRVFDLDGPLEVIEGVRSMAVTAGLPTSEVIVPSSPSDALDAPIGAVPVILDGRRLSIEVTSETLPIWSQLLERVFGAQAKNPQPIEVSDSITGRRTGTIEPATPRAEIRRILNA